MEGIHYKFDYEFEMWRFHISGPFLCTNKNLKETCIKKESSSHSPTFATKLAYNRFATLAYDLYFDDLKCSLLYEVHRH